MAGDIQLLDRVIQRQYETSFGPIGIHRALIDARWRTDEVYQFCLRWPDYAFPVQGQGVTRELWKPMAVSVPANPEKGLPLHGRVFRISLPSVGSKDTK